MSFVLIYIHSRNASSCSLILEMFLKWYIEKWAAIRANLKASPNACTYTQMNSPHDYMSYSSYASIYFYRVGDSSSLKHFSFFLFVVTLDQEQNYEFF